MQERKRLESTDFWDFESPLPQRHSLPVFQTIFDKPRTETRINSLTIPHEQLQQSQQSQEEKEQFINATPFGPRPKLQTIPFKNLGQPPLIPIQIQGFSTSLQLGKGAYASVRLAVDNKTKEKVAIKAYQKAGLLDINRKKSVLRQIKILGQLDHPNILKLFQTVQTEQHLSLVMEYIKGSQLNDYIRKRPERKLAEVQAKYLYVEILRALEYCHIQNVTHRDIKLENILIDSEGLVKIIDFGFATCFSHARKIKLFCGTPSYMAPQIHNRKEYSGPPVDIWASGVILFVMISGKFPFKGQNDQELVHRVRNGVPAWTEDFSDDAKRFLSRILKVKPEERATARQLLKDQWLKVDVRRKPIIERKISLRRQNTRRKTVKRSEFSQEEALQQYEESGDHHQSGC